VPPHEGDRHWQPHGPHPASDGHDRQAPRAYGCTPLLPRERLSWIAVNFSLPPGIKYSEFAPRMQAEGFFLLYGVPGNESHFQVSTIGDLTDADVEGLCRAFDRVLAPIVQTRAATEAARVHGGAS
jgi:aspartate aminotransferase-like enzyme